MYKKQIGQQILFLLSINFYVHIFSFVFILVRVDSLQYLKNYLCPSVAL